MNLLGCLVLCIFAIAVGEIRRAGWLDRVVQYHKNRFYEEMKQLAPITIQASIEDAPVGYIDSPKWNFESVARLLALISQNEKAKPLQMSLRRALAPKTRRFMNKHMSYKFFPSLQKFHKTEFYYDSGTYENLTSDENSRSSELSDSSVVVVRNPVEARLPSARISVKLLREILEARAIAARKMPTKKTTSGYTWPSHDDKTEPVTTAPELESTDDGDNNTTETAVDEADAESGSTATEISASETTSQGSDENSTVSTTPEETSPTTNTE